ncbi:MAG: hypothetical protein WDM79_13400 [Terricaulis sp.]
MSSALPPRSEASADAAPLELAAKPMARTAIVQRLTEIVSWPESRIPAYERQLAADILVGMLRTSGVELRRRCALGLILIHEAPKALLRYLARDEIKVARELLETAVSFDDSDLIATIRAGVTARHRALARHCARRNLNEAVTDALMQDRRYRRDGSGAAQPKCAALHARRRSHRVAFARGVWLAAASGGAHGIAPDAGFVLFWWAPFEVRVHILRRFCSGSQRADPGTWRRVRARGLGRLERCGRAQDLASDRTPPTQSRGGGAEHVWLA